MTAHAIAIPQKRKRSISKTAVWAGMLLFCMLLLLKNAADAVTFAREGLLLCAKSVIPSLFPFMVLSELAISSGISDALPRSVSAPLQKLLGISPVACTALILGLLCGFPVGARCLSSAYKKGLLSKSECERVLLFCNIPSAAYLINTLGETIWNNKGFGILLYVSSLLVALLAGVLCNPDRKKKERSQPTEIPLFRTAQPKGALLLTDAVGAASKSMLLVCAYVVFFSTLVGTLNGCLERYGIPDTVGAALFCLFELSGGVWRASMLPHRIQGMILSAFACGWAGLSVHFQIRGVCAECDFSFRKYHLSKLIQGIALALITLVWCALDTV